MLSLLVAVVVAAVAAAYFYLCAGGSAPGRAALPRKVALDPGQFQKLTLKEKIVVSHDTRIFRVALQTDSTVLGLPIGQHIQIRGEVTGEDGKTEVVQHAYTPISSDDEVGYVDFMIKVYMKNVHPKFPAGGRLTQYLDGLKIGDSIEMRGPSGRFEYLGKGRFTVKAAGAATRPVRQVSGFSCVAGGTGITPILQILRAILKDPGDRTKVSIVYGNQTEGDILLRKELDEAAKDARVSVWYTIDRDAPPTWQYDTGYVSEEMFRKHLLLPEQQSDVVALMCGPPPMVTFAIKPNLQKIGYTDEMMFSF